MPEYEVTSCLCCWIRCTIPTKKKQFEYGGRPQERENIDLHGHQEKEGEASILDDKDHFQPSKVPHM